MLPFSLADIFKISGKIVDFMFSEATGVTCMFKTNYPCCVLRGMSRCLGLQSPLTTVVVDTHQNWALKWNHFQFNDIPWSVNTEGQNPVTVIYIEMSCPGADLILRLTFLLISRPNIFPAFSRGCRGWTAEPSFLATVWKSKNNKVGTWHIFSYFPVPTSVEGHSDSNKKYSV